MLSLHKVKKVLNPVNKSLPEDDFKILDSWTESDDNVNPSKAKMNYLRICGYLVLNLSYANLYLMM